MSTSPSGRRRRWGRRSAVVVTVAVAFVIAGWRLTGGQWQIVATPSMGAAVPVGTLVLTRPATPGDLSVGDVITFRPPGRDTAFTHRIVALGPAGGLRTQGDANGSPDPWQLTATDVVGEVVARWWGIGWLFRGLPLLLLGWALVGGGTRLWAADRWVTPLRVFGSSFVVAVCAVILRPFVNLSVVMSTTGTDGTALTVVSTGILPILAAATGGDELRLLSGQVATLTARPTEALGGYHVTSTPSLTWGWWLALAALWSLPMLWCWCRGAPRPAVDEKLSRTATLATATAVATSPASVGD